ncbi:MAG: hypothetical protein R8G60_17595 [Roseovarius pacificus]|nr:hypothetical protein [Roseovarius pacificus]
MATKDHIFINNAEPDGSINDVVRTLCSSSFDNGRHRITLPTATAFGSLVNVSVYHEGGETFMVTDDGAAYHEITTAAANERTFSSVAKVHCARYGASFDGCSMIFMRVSGSRLRGALIAMGSLIKEVVDETIEKSFAAKVDHARERFVSHVASAFRDYERKEHAHIPGYSNTDHEIDFLVKLNGKSLAFDYFSGHGAAINSAYVKLSDIGRLEEGPAPIGVTPNPSKLGPKLTLISSVARVIAVDSDDKTYRRLAA